MLNLTLRQFRSIIAIHRAGKIASAAKALGLTAPAVTLQLKQMEEELGLALFDRTSDGLRPTAAGFAALECAQGIEDQLQGLSEQVEALTGARKGTLRLGAVSTAKYFAPRLIAAFLKEYPGIKVDLQVGNRAETIDALRHHDLDIALMGRPPRDIAVRSTVFGEHPLVIIAPSEHPLAHKRAISKEEIAKEAFLIRETGSGTRISLEIFFSDLPEKLDDLGTEMGSNETIKQAVMAGLGVAFISAHTIEAEMLLGRLAVLDVEGMPIRRQWFSVSRQDRSSSPSMQAFNEFLVREGPAHLPRIPGTERAPAITL